MFPFDLEDEDIDVEELEEQEQITDVCPVCGKPAKKMVYWGKAY